MKLGSELAFPSLFKRVEEQQRMRILFTLEWE